MGHTEAELEVITDTKRKELLYNLKVLMKVKLVKKNKDIYSITPVGVKILDKFGINKKVIMSVGKKLGYNIEYT